MIHAQNSRAVVAIKPVSIGTTAVTGIVDTLGYEYVQLLTTLDTAATTVTITDFTLSEGDTTSAFTAIAAFTGGTETGNFTLPVGPGTDGDPQIGVIEISKAQYPKRYLKLSLANSAARLSSATALLSRGATTPVSADDRNLAFLVKG
jgi:hypothetical protein